MKFEIQLDARKVYDVITEAELDGASNLAIIIEGETNGKGKDRVIRAYVLGDCISQYVSDITALEEYEK